MHPIVSLDDSINEVLKLTMVKAVSSWRMLQRFLSVMQFFSLTSVSFSFEMSGRWFLAIPIFEFLSYKVIVAASKLLPLPTSACHIMSCHYALILKRASLIAIDDDVIILALGSFVR